MSMTDPIADFLTRLRNGAHAQREVVDIPASRLKTEMARILREEGYIEAYETAAPDSDNAFERLRVRLKYTEDRKPVISGIQRASRPGRRTYAGKDSIPRVHGGMGTTILSTSQGVMTGHQARQQGVGGEVLARVW